MAIPTLIAAREMVLKWGDGVTPTEGFTAVGGITSRSISGSMQADETAVFDLTDPTLAATIVRRGGTQDVSISGSGSVPRDLVADLWTQFQSGNSRNWKIEIFDEAGALFGTFAGAFIMTALEFGAETNGYVSMSISLAQNGTVDFTPAP